MNQNEESYLDKLVAIAGIEGKYYDARGEFREISSKTKRILLSSMELPADDEEIAKKTLYEHEAKPWKRVTPPVAVVRTDKLPAEIVITLPAEVPNELLSWVLEEEDGYLHTGTVRFEDMNLEETRVLDGEKLARRKFILPVTPSLGYHKLLFEYHNDISGKGEMTLIVVPPKCYMPSGLDRDINTWGFPVQLYALNSKRNWGIGDFTDLEKMITTAANLGAGIVGINPVNTLFPDDPNDACPYGSCSRHFLNFMYIDVEGVLEFADSSKAKEFMDTNEFKSTMEQVKKAELIDYVAVASLKQPVLEILYNDFLQKHIKEKTSRGDEFKKFCMKKGLEKLAVFQALSEKIAPETPTPNWRTWSKEYRNSNSDEVVKFAEENRERIDFFKYLQWESDRQLTKVSDVCWSQSMEVGLYQDLAVGVAGHSAETWAEPELFADEIFIGSPPDDMNPEGQEWGLSPFTPMALQETAYEPFKRIMHANMRFAGALRLDHVMGLRRLYWTVSRDDRVHGGYVAYPFEDLLGIVCLESHRRRCIVVGEDLGAVPDGFRERLLEASILSFRLFCFERHWDTTGEFKKPEEYPVEALAAAGTHDLPTLNGYWLGKDIELGEKFGHFVCKEEKQQAIDNRKKDRTNIIKVLKQHEVLPEDIYKDNEFLEGNSVSYGYVEAIYRYLARTPCPLLLVQMEDVLGQETQVNLPNTTMEYPNWRRRLPVHLENLADDERVQNICAAMREERPVPAQLETAEDIRAVIPAVPASTYRIQFSPSFILYDAERLVPYLSALGVTHVYSSPFMKAVSGSEHGYNIVDYNQINSEIGGKDALDQLSDSLKRSGIGLILDFVPNHMGITNGENPWWQDVMEWGKQSPNAKYFDIDWNPAKKELKDKVLVPLLGNYYGKVLENGELHLVFDRMEGTFCVWYNEQRFPICPSHYGYILEKGEDSIEDFLSEEVRTLVEDFNELGVKGDGTGAFREKRCEKATELKQRLAEITNKEKEASKLIENSLLMFNGITGNTKSFNELHLLLEKQAYRICYWRVASNEVNYRRFFSINELAGLRVDLNEVFDQIHVLLFKLITEGKLQGLRIDHIDGLL
ncbi:MAG: 4-alpha-glucanotransferase, partial [Alphaproteobacteria bacterium]|nr:4-alpha-glucanotransferase [Alphaproteobacteria bacterium]